MTTRIEIYGVNAYRALGGVLRDGYGRFVSQWDSDIWEFWGKLRRDQCSLGRDAQPPEVDAYILTREEACLLLGVTLSDNNTPCVLFIFFDGPDDDASPQRAVVVAETRLEAEAEDEDDA